LKNVLLFLLPFASLFAQIDDSWKIYDDSHLARVDITIDSLKLKWIYNNVQSDSEHVAIFRFRNNWIDETIDSIGFRLRGNTSRNSAKKSFKVSFNTFIKGRQFHGIEKLNLNGEHNDPSIIRSKLSFDLFHDIGYPASRANHVRVYINGKYYGLYISVEHIDEEFLKKNFADDSGNLWKCLYPADLQYLGSDPGLYKAIMNNSTTPAYELTTNETADDFTKLVRLIDILNNTTAAALPDSVEQYLSVYRILQYFAINTLVGSWDDYRSLMNNYYLYHVPSEDRFTLIPYDYDNTFGIDWFNINWATADPYNFPKASAGARPLAEKLLANNQYRDLFTHFLRFYREKAFLLPLWESRIDKLKDSITAAALEDTYRTLDWGFTSADFNNSFSAQPYSNQHVKYGLKQFVNARNTSLPAQLSNRNAYPIAYTINVVPRFPSPVDTIHVIASCFGVVGIKEIRLQYTANESSNSTSSIMQRSPLLTTKHVEDIDRWIGVLPPLGAGVGGTLSLVLEDSLGQVQTYPRGSAIQITTSSFISASLIINEFLADNTTIPDPAGEYEDWIELYNPTSASISLTNKFLTDKAGTLTKWKFTQPNLTLAPNEYLVVWCDEDAEQQGIHTNFKLSASGEFIALTDTDGITVLDSLSFGQQQTNISFGRNPNTPDVWSFIIPTPGLPNSAGTLVNEGPFIPLAFTVQAFPNPFNPSINILVTRLSTENISLKIFDVLGREIYRLQKESGSPGTFTFRWDGKTNNGFAVSSGMYFLRASSGSHLQSLKLVLAR
jgi:hypothetical protein